jgi:hypothetical protein
MRFKSVVGCATLLGLSVTLTVGCDTSGSAPQMIKAPPVDGGKLGQPLPKERDKGGGPASSGNMKTMPGDDT